MTTAPLPSQPPIYVINLERADARRQRIGVELDALGLRHEIFPAVDGSRLDARTLASAYDPARARAGFRDMSQGEIACALSHLGACRAMLAAGATHALVLEDDARPGPALPGVLAALSATVPPDEPLVVLLTHVDKYTAWGGRPLQGSPVPARLVRRYHEWWRAHGYLVTRAAAQRLVDGLPPIHSPADHWSRFEREGLVNLRAVVPYCIGLSELAEHSSLEAHRADKDQADKSRRSLTQWLHHYVYRRFLHQILVRPFLRVKRQQQSW